ncbi:ABC-type transport auxiliary lipoprotein family protein [Pacificimonas flava]|uniref:ABC-type transport auxiliary lipoprotein component domain-containing protein n=1 Tax=Pacificimonas flava TaxID=1234595 RepID=M2SAL4_9SPHN|nr:ABC-type transport auxiliary lipoprotein family protein [Pacificimonas flava]EMD82400.1 hypothetical protein C725_2121 [Pacificimonas flava]MBB5281234.1 cholesterol transport system auxiliary component [Pacificimonas flava]
MKLGAPLILGAALLSTACGPLVQIGGNAEPPASLLTIASTAPPPAATRGDPVLIAMPSVPGKLQTLRVPVTTATNEIKYLGSAAWIEQPNRLFQRVLAAQFAAVTNRPAVDERTPDVVPSARLSGTLTEFGLDVSGGSEVVVAYDAVLTSSRGGFVGSRHFEARRPATQETGPAVAAALGEAANEVAASAAAWAAQGL